MWEFPAAVEQQVQHLVDRRRVRLVRVRHDRCHRRQFLVGEPAVREIGLAGLHPGDVAVDGVELPVVDDVPVRVCEVPRPERVRREPGVDQRHPRPEPVVPQVGVVVAQLWCRQEPLVDDPFPVERDDVRRAVLGRVGVVGLEGRLHRTTTDVEVAVEPFGVGVTRGRDERLPDRRLRRSGGRTQLGAVGVGRHCTPPDDRTVVGRERPLDGLLGGLDTRRWEEEAPDRVRLREIVVDDRLEQPVRPFDHHTRSVTRVRVCSTGATVFHVREQRQRVRDRLV